MRMLKSKYILFAVFLLSAAFVSAQKAERDYIRKGNRLFNDSVFVDAEVNYRKALEVNPKSTVSMYNLGNTLSQQQKMQEAMEQYVSASNIEKDKMKLAQIYHNMGVLLQASKDYAKAVDAYKMSLRNNPADDETRYNLALAQKMLKDQQQNKQNQDQNQDQNKDQQKQDQKQDQNKDKQNDQKQDQKKDQQQPPKSEKQKNQMSKENGLSELLALYGSAYNVNIKIFNDLQHTITGWPGGKPNADDTYRPERAKPYPKRIIVFSPHPDDDVISMCGTIRRLVEQKHDVHVAYETSGNIAVGDEEVIRFLHFINGFNQIFNNSEDQIINEKYTEIRNYLKDKKDGDMDTRDILTIKGLIRRGEARTACTYNNIPLERCHFLDLPFYETGKIQKNPISEADVEIVRNLLREVKPHQIFVAGDLADPHGTHRVCTDAVFAAIDLEKEEGAKWLKDCRIWMYRGAWAEWEIENIEMAVPISPEELRAKRNSILKHQSQMESAPFLGNDERLFWQRSEDRNRGTAALYDKLGLASYEAMEAFVEYIPL